MDVGSQGRGRPQVVFQERGFGGRGHQLEGWQGSECRRRLRPNAILKRQLQSDHI